MSFAPYEHLLLGGYIKIRSVNQTSPPFLNTPTRQVCNIWSYFLLIGSSVIASLLAEKQMDRNFLLPWEHRVCPKCLYQNPHAIWLVKYGCFERFLHEDTPPVTVIVVHETMEMIRIRPLPHNWSSFRGYFDMCRYRSGCQRRYQCKFPHSKAEQRAWNAKKAILKGNTI